MYDFHLGSHEAINKDPWTWLLAVKRMLPRWINGIPDTEFRSLYDELVHIEEEGVLSRHEKPVLVETGCGASTLILLYFALRWDTKHYTWDISSNKLAYLRGLLTDTLFRHFREKNIYDHWIYVAYASTNPHIGIPILAETDTRVAGCFFDSDHTWKTLGAEIELICPQLVDGALVAIDDGNYQYETENTAYINMLRTKQGLPHVDIQDNEGDCFWVRTEGVLKRHFSRVENLEGSTYRKQYHEDIFYAYYNLERSITSELQMEKSDDLDHRFDAWRVYHE